MIRCLRSLAVAVAVALALGAPAPASAAVVRALDVAELCRASDVVARGVVVGSRATWEGRRIVTLVEVRILESLKGEPGTSVVVSRPGGMIDGLAMGVPGAAKLTVGDEVVLFLQRKGDNYHSLGMGQGVYHVQIDARSGERIARQDLDGLAMLDATGKLTAERRAPAAPLRVVDLIAEIRKNLP
jgi:hypothetical protein